MQTPPAGPILVVESDRQLASALTEQLIADGFTVELAHSANHARILARENTPRLVLLGELDMPRGALDLLEEIRGCTYAAEPWQRNLPAVVLGSSPNQLDLLRAFEAGADDFMFKPAYLELRARLRAILRRVYYSPLARRTLEVGPLTIELDTRAVTLQGRPVSLRRMEFELLAELAREPARVFAKHELLRAVWGYRSSGSTRTLDSHASRLRRKLDQDGSGRWVINVRGVGYRLK
jgi:DNA-binding response OmpR family regulator